MDHLRLTTAPLRPAPPGPGVARPAPAPTLPAGRFEADQAPDLERLQALRQLTEARNGLAPLDAPVVDAAPRTLTLGAEGADVARLQAVLTGLGHYAGPASGQFDAPTRAAVLAYQGRFRLAVDGAVGPATWARVLDHEGMLTEGRAQLTAQPAGARPVPVPRPRVTAPANEPPAFAPRHNIRLDAGATPYQGAGGPDASPEERAYRDLLAFNDRPNPHSVEQTRELGLLARRFQLAMPTEQVRVSVEGGAHHLLVTVPLELDKASALQAVVALYESSPPEHRRAITHVNLFTGPSAQDEYWEKVNQYDKDLVSEMTGGRGTISIFNVGNPDHPQRQDHWDHELAHIFMEHSPHESDVDKVPEGWAEAVARDRADGEHEFASPYAELNSLATGQFKEDFADTYRLFVDARREGKLERFRNQFPHRCEILDQLFS